MSTTIQESIPAQLAHRTWQILLGLGLVGIVLGVAVLVWPGQSLRIVGILFGVFLIVSGVGEFLLGLTAPLMNGGYRFLNIFTGVLSFVLGVMCFRSEVGSLALLAIWIGIGWITTGFSRLFALDAFSGLPGRGWAIAGACLTILAGVLAIVYPIASVGALAIFAGIWLIVTGAVQIGHGLQWRALTKEVSATN